MLEFHVVFASNGTILISGSQIRTTDKSQAVYADI